MTKKKDPTGDILAAAKLAKVKQFRNLLEKIKAGTINAAEMKIFQELENQLSQEEVENPNQSTPAKLTSKEVQAYLGISRRMVSYHTTKGNLKRNSDGTFNKAELDRWAQRYNRKSKRQAPDSDGGTVGEQKDLADLRYKKARAEREELVTAQLKGSLYNRDEVEAALAELVLTTKRAFLLLPHQAPTLLAGKDPVGQMETLQSMVDEIITGLSEEATYKQIEKRLEK
ncbi:MAG: hypothetical protein ACLFUL_14595 [Desulfobacteraceae bacterium]